MMHIYSTMKPLIATIKYLGVLIFCALFAAISGVSAATTYTWTDAASNNDWTASANWSPAGAPAATGIALFDGGGDAGTITVGTQAIGTIQFGQATDLTSIQGYTLGAGTLNFSTGALNIVNYYGSANTTTQTIDADMVLNYGSTLTANNSNTYTINNSSAGDLVFNGAITNAAGTGTFTTASAITVSDTGTGDITFNGSISLNASLTALVNVGNTVTINGSVRSSDNYIVLGNSGTGYGATAYGNLVVTGALTSTRLYGYGSQGAIVLSNSTGLTYDDGGYLVFLENGHNSEAFPNLEIAKGNYSLVGTNALDYGQNAATGTSSYYIEVDSGASVVVGGFYDGAGIGTASNPSNQVVELYGAGNGVLGTAGNIIRNTAYNVGSVVKDGTGTWAFYGTNNSVTPGVKNGTYTGGTTVKDGTFLVLGNGSTGTGAVLVDPTNSKDDNGNANPNAKPILGGRGTILGAVTLANGATIAPGGTASLDIGAAITSPIGHIGTLTVSSITVTLGSTFAFEVNIDVSIGSSSLFSSDNLTVTGSLSLGSATLSLQDLGSSQLGAGDYFNLISFSGTWTGGQFDGLAQGDTIFVGQNLYEIDYGVGHLGEVTLDWVAVPEPSSIALGVLGVAVILLRTRVARRNKGWIC